ncbi:LysM peptidoglycan-binding domain-containing protein [Ruegeria sp. 2012CJ41-6]|uniref:LysM peptidoglycan-binding domain-containing protein n=1 Tax=Ruegeria spongiae TaxID=2942209 RepID=A0ABT0Q5C7_9RHOB|nr:LysM peptidoglycan-binding domain-containing protein [Ruegeria spongiae]MCL6285020.1 LysM peptidoglycan-binding domain-containing protein [Ruegeria spongiae]
MAENAGDKGSGKATWIIVAGGVAVAGAAAIYFLSPPDQPAPDPAVIAETATGAVAEDAPIATAPAETDAPDTDSTAENAPEGPASPDDADISADPASDAESAEAPVAVPDDLDAPELDLIRVAPDGATILAGRGTPGSKVKVLVDGDEVHAFEVDQSGQFAAFFPIVPGNAPRTLTLQTEQGDQSTLSDDFLIAASPEAAPEQVASADPPTGQDAEGDTAAPPAQTTEPTGTTDAPSQTTESADAASTGEERTTPEASGPEAETGSDETVSAEVAPAEAPAILRSGEEGVELVQSPQQQDATAPSLQLDTIGYTNQGQVELTGRAAPGATVRAYLDNRALRDLSVGEDGRWRGEIAGIDPGTYTLRLDALGKGGKVIDRLETPFRREAPELLVASDTDVATQTATIRAVTVQQGDTLWAISRDRYGDGVFYVKVFDANRDSIRNPDLIYPGQIFNLPE